MLITGQARDAIKVLVISPTRELASQIYDEVGLLCRYNGLTAQVVVGGTNIKKDITALKNIPDILIATPGRLNDHLENGPLRKLIQNLKVLVFDEADQLLDMGFRPAIEKTLKNLAPKETRQTLLFSATMPADVSKIASMAMRDGASEFVDTVGEEESTHQHVEQRVVLSSMEQQAGQLLLQLKEARKVEGHKVVVFFTTARTTQFYAELFNLMGEPVLEMHSRLSQSKRTKVSDHFRDGSNLVMFSSVCSSPPLPPSPTSSRTHEHQERTRRARCFAFSR